MNRRTFTLFLAALFFCNGLGCAKAADPQSDNAAQEPPLSLKLRPEKTVTQVAQADPTERQKQLAELSKVVPEDMTPYAAGSSPETTRTGEDWPRFLGLRDTGVSGETGLLAQWPKAGPPIVWQKTIGTGYTAPSVRGNLCVLHHRLRNEEIVQAYAADTGEPVWKFAYPSNFRDPYGYNNGPRCTPLLTKDHCYTFGAEGKLLCLDLQKGTKIWMRETAKDWNIPESFFGVGSTPILHGKLLIVMVGGLPKSGLVAFNSENGETVWESVGKKTWPIEENEQLDDKLASYATLTAAQIHGKWHILALMRDGLVSVDPLDGHVNFSYVFRAQVVESVNAARPIVIDDKVFLSAAYRTGAAMLQVKPDGQSVDQLWKNRVLETHWSTTIHHDGFLYGFSGRHEQEGAFRCVTANKGKIAWQTDGDNPDVPASDDLEVQSSRYYGRGSAIMAEGKFIVLGERGLLALVEVNSEEFKEISRVKYPQMSYPSWAAPVLSRGRVYLRCEDNLLCLDLAAPAKK